MSEKSEKLLEDILEEIKTLNQGITLNNQKINDMNNNIVVMTNNFADYKKETIDAFDKFLKSQEILFTKLLEGKAEKERVEMLSFYCQILNGSGWALLQEEEEKKEIITKLSKTITKKILKLAPSIKD